ncbi:hypothetical protein BG015_011624 [Linnemannia schmuckeri]|uniref:W2 domain-containing protein n=1 Tax=Linnemannia schmuckeri TaxID=64567 RepID=A0A9P5RUH8_9FUNG|nr:hypothetical protein BG015_011624 [Linnemannia schmuckeri]
MCSLYSINNNSKFSGQSSFQVVLCAKDSSSSSPHHSPVSSISSSAPCSPSRRKKMKGGAKSPILILTPSPNQQLQEITALFSPPSFQSTTQSSSSPSTSSSSPSSSNNPSSAAHYRANSNSSTTSPSSLSYQQQHQQQRRRQGSNHGTSHWHQFHQHQHYHHHNSFDVSFENDQENQHPYSTTYAHKRASIPIDQQSNHSFYHNKRSNSTSGASSKGIRGRDTGNARSAQVLNPTNLQIHSKTFFPSQSTPTPTHSSSTTLLLSAQQQPYNHSSSNSNLQQQRRPVAAQLADPAVISFAAAAAASVSGTGAGVGARGGASSSMSSPSSSTFRSPESSPIRQTSIQGGSHTAWSDMKSFPSDRALAAATVTATAPSSLSLSTLPTMTGKGLTTTPVATPAAVNGQGAHGSQANPRDRSPLASSVDSHGHSTFDSDEMDLQHQHSDSNIDSDASMTEADVVDLDPATSLQSMQTIHPRRSLQQKQQQSQHHKTVNYRHSLNHHFNQHFPLLSSTSSPSAATAANTAAVAATAAAVASTAVTAAAVSSAKGAESHLERKSHLRRKCDRLQVKNAALKATVIQVKSDLALERQRRSTVDQIYLSIRKDLNQRLESEEDKVLSLKADLEQMAAEMKELKDQLASARTRSTPFSTSASMSSLSGLNSRSVNGYRIGYDSSAFSLSRGISTFGGVLMPHNSSLIDGQDDSEEFMLSHSYSPSSRRASVSQPANMNSTLMSCSDDEVDDDDEEMEEEDESDDESCTVKGAFLFKQSPVSRRGSLASSLSLRTLAEETIEEEEEEDDDDELDEEDEVDSDLEDRTADKDDIDGSDAPRTMMEIILQRQQSRSPEDDMEDPPADANETFDSMVQKSLLQAIHSRLTVAQAQLQIEELVLKYDAPPDKIVEAITRGMLRWWETERLATGGSASGGFGTDAIVINKETGEQATPKVAIEKRIESFFGPLLLQFVASIDEQKMLLETLGQQAQAEPEGRWLKNHNGILVALYKYDVLDGEAVLEWWRALEEPQGVFGHGGNNLRSLNSRFAAWLEDEDEESDSESEGDEDNDTEEDSDSDSSCSEFESDSEDDDDDYVEGDEGGDADRSADVKDAMDQDAVVEAILDVAFPKTSSPTPSIAHKESESNSNNKNNTTGNAKRRINFCTNNNLYYSQDGKVQQQPARKAKNTNSDGSESKNRVDGEAGEDDQEGADDAEDGGVAKKKYDQCPPFKGIIDRDIEIGTMA